VLIRNTGGDDWNHWPCRLETLAVLIGTTGGAD